MKGWAIIFDWLATTPVYHAFDQDRLAERGGDGVYRSYSQCGLLASTSGCGSDPGSWIPERHAEKFARPCRKCFVVDPDLAGDFGAEWKDGEPPQEPA